MFIYINTHLLPNSMTGPATAQPLLSWSYRAGFRRRLTVSRRPSSRLAPMMTWTYLYGICIRICIYRVYLEDNLTSVQLALCHGLLWQLGEGDTIQHSSRGEEEEVGVEGEQILQGGSLGRGAELYCTVLYCTVPQPTCMHSSCSSGVVTSSLEQLRLAAPCWPTWVQGY